MQQTIQNAKGKFGDLLEFCAILSNRKIWHALNFMKNFEIIWIKMHAHYVNMFEMPHTPHTDKCTLRRATEKTISCKALNWYFFKCYFLHRDSYANVYMASVFWAISVSSGTKQYVHCLVCVRLPHRTNKQLPRTMEALNRFFRFKYWHVRISESHHSFHFHLCHFSHRTMQFNGLLNSNEKNAYA